MNEKEFYLILGFVKISQYRINTLKSIGETLKMPSEIARENNYKTSQVSSALYDLKRKNLVFCVNEEVRKGRLYKCTPLGLKILSQINE